MLYQKTAEDLEYSELLDQAADFPPGSVERLLRVAAFAIRWACDGGSAGGGRWATLFALLRKAHWGPLPRPPRPTPPFALRSPYSSTPGRTAKPFNPLLGETFEFVCPEKGFRFLAEKVRGRACVSVVRGCLQLGAG